MIICFNKQVLFMCTGSSNLSANSLIMVFDLFVEGGDIWKGFL